MPRRRSITDQDRDARALVLRTRGYSYDYIARELGWKGRSSASDACRRARNDMYKDEIDAWHQMALDQLDELTVMANEAIREAHYLVSQGKVVKDDDGNMLANAVERVTQLGTLLLKINESRRKFLGLDAAPQKAPVQDNMDAEIERLVAELGAVGEAPAGSEAAAARPASG